eukprot:s7023_g1.t1
MDQYWPLLDDGVLAALKRVYETPLRLEAAFDTEDDGRELLEAEFPDLIGEDLSDAIAALMVWKDSMVRPAKRQKKYKDDPADAHARRFDAERKKYSYLLSQVIIRRVFPKDVKDVIDYMQHRVSNECGRTVPESFSATLGLLEQLGKVPEDERISSDPLWKGRIRSWTAELSEEAPPKKPAEMFTVAILISLELVVVAESETLFSRALAWVVLCMVWGAMRCDDVQAVLPSRMLLSNF